MVSYLHGFRDLLGDRFADLPELLLGGDVVDFPDFGDAV
jgi:hypothetical protein